MKRSTVIVGLAIVMLAVYATLSLASVQRDLRDAMEQTEALRAEIVRAREEGEHVRQKLNELETDEGMAELARQRLRLVLPDSEIFIDR